MGKSKYILIILSFIAIVWFIIKNKSDDTVVPTKITNEITNNFYKRYNFSAKE